jgi:protein phosphatase
MSYTIDYTTLCERGKVRTKNQDNFWCQKHYLASDNQGLAAPLVGFATSNVSLAFAVFDGMGGESHGEIAAYLAAKTFDELCAAALKSDMERFLVDSCFAMNDRICTYITENRIRRMGTTAAIIGFDENEVTACNLGDSKIFRYSKGEFAQLSCDHLMDEQMVKKPALSQYLGIPADDFVIAPHITKTEFVSGDRYLLCSDGLTDMVADKEIKRLLSKHKTISKCAAALMKTALVNGGKDNITIMLCELTKNKGV